MIPKIFKGDVPNFRNNGYGFLRDITSGMASEERNGGMSIEIKYPVNGHNKEHLVRGNIIMAKASERLGMQPYRIYSVKKSENGRELIVLADHYTFDIKKNFIKEWEARGSAKVVMNNFTDNLELDTDITFESDIETESSTKWVRRNPLTAIAGEEGSMIQIWGGEIKRDGKKISLLRKRGRDGVVTIRNRKDLLGLELEESDLEVITRIYPFKVIPIEGDVPEGQPKEKTITLTEVYVDSKHVDDYPRVSVAPIDFADDESVVDEETLRKAANAWFGQNTGVDIPKVTGNIQIQELSKTTEYAKFKDLVSVDICDKINVISTNIDVKIQVAVNKTVYDFVKEEFVNLEVGDKVMSYGEGNKQKWNSISKEIETIKQDVNWAIEVGNGNKNFYGPNEPFLPKENDLWFRTKEDGSVEVYRYNGSSWELTIDPSLAEKAKEMAEKAQEMADKNAQDMKDMLDDVANIKDISEQASKTANEGKALAEGADANATKALQEAQDAFNKINNLDTSTRNIILDNNITSAIPNTATNTFKKDGYLISLKTDGALDFGVKATVSSLFSPGEAYVFGYRFRKNTGDLKRIGGNIALMGDIADQRWFLDGEELTADKIVNNSFEAPNDTDWHTVLIMSSKTIETDDKSLYIKPNYGVEGDPLAVTIQVDSIYSYRSTLITNAWTPAPEDAIAEFTKINGELSSKISKTEIDDVLEQKGVATQKWTQSEIKQSSDKISAEVQKVEQSVGNMLNNSTKSGTLDRWSVSQVNKEDFSLETIVVNGENTIAQKSIHRGTANLQMLHEAVSIDVGSTYEIKMSLKSSKTAANFFVGLFVMDEKGKNLGNVKTVDVKTGVITATNNNPYFWVGQLVEERWTDVVGYIMPSNTDPKDLIGVGKNVQSAIILPPEAKSVSIRYLNYVGSTAEEVTLYMVNPSMTRTANQTTVQNAKLTIANDAITQTVSDVKKEVDGLAPSSPPNLIDDSKFKKKGQGYWSTWGTGNRAFIRNQLDKSMRFRALKTGAIQQGIDIRSVGNLEKGKTYKLSFRMSGTVSIVNPILITEAGKDNVSLGIAYITPEVKKHEIVFTWETDAKTASLTLLSPANDPKVGYMDLEEGIYLREGSTNTVDWMPSENDILTNSGSSNALVDTDKAKENIPAKMVIKKVPYNQKAGSFTAEPSPLNDSWTKYTTTGSGPTSFDIGTSNQVIAKVGFSEYQGLETLKPGDDVTFSIDVLVEELVLGSNINIIFFQLLNGVQWSGMYTETITKEVGITRVSMTDKILPGTTGILCRVQIGTLPGNIVHMGRPSLIVGSEDLGYNLPEKEISSNISNIQQTANDITTTVSSLNYGQVNLVKNSQFTKTVGTNSVKYWLVTGITAMTYSFDSGVLKITSTRDNAWIGININVEGGVIKDEWYSFSVEYYGDGTLPGLASVGVQAGGPNSTISQLPKTAQFTRFAVTFQANYTSGRNVNLWVQGPPNSVHYFRKPMLNKSKIPMAYTPNVSEAGEYASEIYQSSEQIKTTVTQNKKDADQQFSMVDQKADSIISTVSGFKNNNWISNDGAFDKDEIGKPPKNWKMVLGVTNSGSMNEAEWTDASELGWGLEVVANPFKGQENPSSGYINRSEKVLRIKCGEDSPLYHPVLMYMNDDGSDYWNENISREPIYSQHDNAWSSNQAGVFIPCYFYETSDGTRGWDTLIRGINTKNQVFRVNDASKAKTVPDAVKVRPMFSFQGFKVADPQGYVWLDNIVYKREPTTSQVVQMADRISLSITQDNVITSINLSKEGVAIKGKNILLDGDVTINGPAFAKAFTVVDLNADSIKTGSIDASKINVVKINASEIYTGTIKGANLEINLNTGEVVFQKGIIRRADGKFHIDITKGIIESYTSLGGFTLKDGEMGFYNNSYLNSNGGPLPVQAVYGKIMWQWGFFATRGISVRGETGWHIGTTNSSGAGMSTGSNTIGSTAYGDNNAVFVEGSQRATFGGGPHIGNTFITPRPKIVFSADGIYNEYAIRKAIFSNHKDTLVGASIEIIGNRIKNYGTSTHMYAHVNDDGVFAVKNRSDGYYRPVQGSEFIKASQAKIKQNITEWRGDEHYKSAKEIMVNSKAYTYAYNGDIDSAVFRKKPGLVVEMSSKEIVSEDGTGISSYAMATTNWEVTSQHINEIESLQKEVKELWEVIALLKNEAFKDITE